MQRATAAVRRPPCDGRRRAGRGRAQQRLIWPDALHEDAIWEGPMFERPVSFVGRVAVGYFFEFLLSVVPRFSTQLHAA